MDKILSAGIAIMNPDPRMFERMWKSMVKYAPELEVIVVVDNGDDDSEYSIPLEGPVAMSVYEFRTQEHLYSVKEFKTEKLFVAVLHAEENKGFGVSHNDALAFIKASEIECQYHAVLNDDIEFFAPWAEPMIGKMRKEMQVPGIFKDFREIEKEYAKQIDKKELSEKEKKQAFLNAVLKEAVVQVGLMNGTCNKVNFVGTAWGEHTETPDYCEGSCFIAETKIINETFPLFRSDIYKMGYCEDTDLSFRIRAAGYEIAAVFVPWVHHRAKTSSKMKVDMIGHGINNNYKFHKEWNGFLIKKKKVPFYVIRRTGSIGDAFLATAVAHELKQREDCAVAVATTCVDLVETSPAVDVVYPDPYTPFACTEFIDLDNSYERDFSNKSIVQIYMETAGINNYKQKTGVLGVRQKNITRAKNLLEKIRKRTDKIAVLDLSDTWPGKQWNYSNYVKLSKMLYEKADVVVIGNKSDYIQNEYCTTALDLVNRLDILDTAALLSMVDLYVGHEGMVLHIAQALQTIEHIGLYSCQVPELVNDTALKTWHGVIAKVECRGCRNRYAAGNKVICGRNHICMQTITVEEVFEECIKVFK